MNELMIFENPRFGEIRTLNEKGKTLFCAKDVAAALGYRDTTNAIKQHYRGVVKRHLTDKLGRQQETNFIPEGDIYRLAARSELPGAEQFESWIFDEVLPAIRRRGAYARPQADPSKVCWAEAALNNSRARLAAEWRKLAQAGATPEYRQICAHYASAQLTGGEAVLPLPPAGERTYTAAEVGKMLGGLSANQIGRLANANGLKAPGYGLEVWDKSPYSQKQVVSWRYNDKAVQRLREIQAEDLG